MTAPRRRKLLTVDEVHAMTTLSPSTLYDWAAKGKGPRTFRLGGRRVYDEASVLEWIAEQERAANEADDLRVTRTAAARDGASSTALAGGQSVLRHGGVGRVAGVAAPGRDVPAPPPSNRKAQR